ncbi:Hypothetical predicted protein [Cloeon dipterum]|uniref:Uncharacterized protein n=1 Tax=Cloeon dipterum TaxID=197152 RepID=A0A8S1C6K3_9INSE|nr:Hypothetical predicted protein [Cloeon dipterum]
MASQEHLKLSSFIKEVHHTLRVDAATYGFEAAWSKHCKDLETLKEYAQNMAALAQEHWEQNSKTDFAESRIQWAHSQCLDYYLGGGLRKADEEETKKMSTLLKSPLYSIGEEISELSSGKIKLLDVGSCYNPFASFDIYEVEAIDIAPGERNVKKCDFLNVNISQDKQLEIDSELNHLEEQSFDVVVFSLLLEYFPCAQASECTLDETVESCTGHFGLLEDPEFPKHWATMEQKKCQNLQQFESPASMIVIPQDSKLVQIEPTSSCSVKEAADPAMFDQLPNFE